MEKISRAEVEGYFKAAARLKSRRRRELLCELAWRLRTAIDFDIKLAKVLAMTKKRKPNANT